MRGVQASTAGHALARGGHASIAGYSKSLRESTKLGFDGCIGRASKRRPRSNYQEVHYTKVVSYVVSGAKIRPVVKFGKIAGGSGFYVLAQSSGRLWIFVADKGSASGFPRKISRTLPYGLDALQNCKT